MCVCLSLCTIIVVDSSAQNSSDNLPSYPPNSHHSSAVVIIGGESTDEREHPRQVRAVRCVASFYFTEEWSVEKQDWMLECTSD